MEVVQRSLRLGQNRGPIYEMLAFEQREKEIVGQISALAWAIFNHSYLNVVKTDSQFFIQGQKSTQQLCVCGGRNRKEHSFSNSSAQNIISQKTEIVVTEKSKYYQPISHLQRSAMQKLVFLGHGFDTGPSWSSWWSD